MPIERENRNTARVDMHLNDRHTKCMLEAAGGLYFDIPTARIPPHLRPLGSRFTIVVPAVLPEPDDDDQRAYYHWDKFWIEEILPK